MFKNRIYVLLILSLFVFSTTAAYSIELKGKIVDIHGISIKNARVRVIASDYKYNSRTINRVTDDRGLFQFDDLKNGKYIIEVEDGVHQFYSMPFMILDEEPPLMEIIMKKTSEYTVHTYSMGEPVGYVSGLVTDKFKIPIEGAVVVIEKDFAITDDTGHFELNRVYTGKRKLKVIKGGFKTLYSNHLVLAGKQKLNLRIEREELFSVVYGKIRIKRFPRGADIPPMKVIFGERIAVTDADGRFTINGVRSGNHHVSVIYNKRELYTDIVKVDKGKFAFEILLERLK